VTRIIEPLASRCAKFRFQALPAASMKERLLMIAENENFTTKEIDLIDEILLQSNGDMRRAVTTLQSLHSLAIGEDLNDDTKDSTLSKETISEIAGIPPSSVMDELWNVLAVPQSSTSFDRMYRTVEDVCCAGYSAQSILQSLLPRIIGSDDKQNNEIASNANLSEISKAKIAIRMAEAEKKMIDGADEYLQLMTVCTLILSCYQVGS
jgi:replication factor C subunit 2/4